VRNCIRYSAAVLYTYSTRFQYHFISSVCVLARWQHRPWTRLPSVLCFFCSWDIMCSFYSISPFHCPNSAVRVWARLFVIAIFMFVDCAERRRGRHLPMSICNRHFSYSTYLYIYTQIKANLPNSDYSATSGTGSKSVSSPDAALMQKCRWHHRHHGIADFDDTASTLAEPREAAELLPKWGN
jgi:hypothetical protein